MSTKYNVGWLKDEQNQIFIPFTYTKSVKLNDNGGTVQDTVNQVETNVTTLGTHNTRITNLENEIDAVEDRATTLEERTQYINAVDNNGVFQVVDKDGYVKMEVDNNGVSSTDFRIDSTRSVKTSLNDHDTAIGAINNTGLKDQTNDGVTLSGTIGANNLGIKVNVDRGLDITSDKIGHSSTTSSETGTAQTLGSAGKFSIPVPTVDTYGHVTKVTTTQYTLPTIPALSGGTAAAADAKVIGGITVSKHAITAAQKELTAGANITITGAKDKITISSSGITRTESTSTNALPILASAQGTTSGSTGVDTYYSSNISMVPKDGKIIATTFAGNATSASKLSAKDNGDTDTPVYFKNGVPVACTAIDLNAASASKLSATDDGDSNTPVYFKNGVPVACTAIDLNAASATKLKTARNITIGNKTNSFNGTAAITYSLDDIGAMKQNPAFIELFPSTSDTNGGYIDFHYAGSTKDHTSRIIESSSGTLEINGITFKSNSTIYSPNNIYMYETGLTKGTAPKENIYASLMVLDSTKSTEAASRCAMLQSYISSDNTSAISLYAYKWAANSSDYARLRILEYSDGTNKIDTNSKIYGAVWNDYAEYRQYQDSKDIPYGRVVVENGNDTLSLSTARLQKGGNICSDTFGFAIGETDEATMPIAVSGRVLAYPYEDRYEYEPGDAVCTGPNGTVSKMTQMEIKEYPDRIIGYVSAIPEYEEWGEWNVKVDKRIWIKVV